jgi:3-hydroxyisobutyrate dehydrogenase-like beta-hydroxyacid dehydrogenase
MDTTLGPVGFIGLGVMGEPICRHLARKGPQPVSGFDPDPAALGRLASDGVRPAASVAEIGRTTGLVFLSLPSGEVVESVCRDTGGLLAQARAGQVIVDLGTSSVAGTRRLAADFAARGAVFVDAPVARTRAAAEAGTLSVMVGADAAIFERLHPWLATFASEISLCGGSGCGQVLKILNNMVLFETVVALSEARAIGRRAGVDPALLFEVLARGSADSFALRNHGMKAIVPGEFPERAFSVAYARKDLRYALALAQECGVEARSAELVDRCFERAIAAGDGDRYHPVISRLLDADNASHDSA